VGWGRIWGWGDDMDQKEVESLGMGNDWGGDGLGAIPQGGTRAREKVGPGAVPREMAPGRRWACRGWWSSARWRRSLGVGDRDLEQ
jgi:hypothetical protein